jgi:hypothetical protein
LSPRRTRRIAGIAAIVIAVVAFAALWRRRTRMRRDKEREPLVLYTFNESDAGLVDSLATLRTLDEARTMEHTAVVMQGDAGGQIYLTVPVKYVMCDEDALRGLLDALDALEWNEPARARLNFELAPIGSGVMGGMGGGLVIDGVWMHKRLDAGGVLPLAVSVIYGRRSLADVLPEFPRSLA